jgi:hypothetical protein
LEQIDDRLIVGQSIHPRQRQAVVPEKYAKGLFLCVFAFPLLLVSLLDKLLNWHVPSWAKDFFRLSNRGVDHGCSTAWVGRRRQRSCKSLDLSYSAVRALCASWRKGRCGKKGRAAYFGPRPRGSRAGSSAPGLFFFDSSAELATLLDESASKLSESDYERLKALIDEAKNKGDRE